MIDIGGSDKKALEASIMAESIIMDLDDYAVKKLVGNNYSEEGIGLIADNLFSTSYETLFGDVRKVSFSTELFVDSLGLEIEKTLKHQNYNYFKISVLPEFEINWHHLEWGDIVQRYLYFNILASRDHGKSHDLSHCYPLWRMYRYKNGLKKPSKINNRNKEGYLFSFSNQQAILLLEKIKNTIEDNDELRDLLFPGTSDGWAKTEIRARNGASIKVRGFGNAVRGAHPGWIIVDDALKDNVIYSAMQRQKNKEYFHAVIMNMIIPDGQVGVIGTPFHDDDLYANLKKLKGWHYREYPAVFPDGRILWKDRYNFEKLMAKREAQGNIIFSREMLCRPIVSDSSLFPFEILTRALTRMENHRLVMNRESFPIKLKAVVVGLDFAISANIGADYSVFTILGLDENDEIWLMNQIRIKGKSYHEQIAIIKGININYRPDLMVAESNQMQMIFAQEMDKEGMPVVPEHTSSGNKNSLQTGVPSLSILFERGKIHFPYDKNDAYTKNTVDNLLAELNSMSFTDKGIHGVGMHDDCVMSLQKGHSGIKMLTQGRINIDYM